MDNEDYKILLENKFTTIIRLKKFIETIKNKTKEPSIQQEIRESPNAIAAESSKENDFSIKEKEWPGSFIFPKEKVSNCLQIILSQPDKDLDLLKERSVLNELVRIVYDEIKSLNM